MINLPHGFAVGIALWVIALWFGSIPAVADTPSATAVSSAAQIITNEYCPVMPQTKSEADLWLDYEGQRIYFCHEVCKTRFKRAPEKYLANLPEAMRQAIQEHQQATTTLGSPLLIEKTKNQINPVSTADHSGLRRVGQFLGQFHPVVIHLPIGLLIAAALAEVLFMWTQTGWLSGAARFCVLVGAITAIGAASLGWLNALSANYDHDLAQVLEYHRWLGTATALLAVVVAIFSELQHRLIVPGWRMVYRLALLLVAVAIGLTGHFGGTLVYGLDYLKW